MVTHPPPVAPGPAAASYAPTPPYTGPQPAPVPFAAPAAVIPYATPASLTPAHAPAEAAWQDGPVLVVRKGVILPPLCVKCGDAAEGSFLKRSLAWHHPGLYFLILVVGPLIYALIATCVQERGTVALHLCAKHRRQRRTFIWTYWAIFFAGMAAIFDGAASSNGWLGLTGGILILGSLVFIAACLPVLRPRRIDSHFMWLGGAAPGFLRTLPSLPRRW